MSAPALYLGSASDGSIVQADRGYLDAGVVYQARVASGLVLLGGTASGEGIVTAAYLQITQRIPPVADGDPYEELSLLVTPLIDGQERASKTLTIRMQPVTDPANPPRRVSLPYEVPLYESVMRGGEEVYRVALRGNTAQIRIEWPGSDAVIDGVELEVEEVRETLKESAS